MDENVYIIAPFVEALIIFFLSKQILLSVKRPHSSIILWLILLAVVPVLLLYTQALFTVLTIPDTNSNGKVLFAANINLLVSTVWLVIPLVFTLIAAALKKVMSPVLLYLLYSPVGLLEVAAIFWIITS